MAEVVQVSREDTEKRKQVKNNGDNGEIRIDTVIIDEKPVEDVKVPNPAA
jgi:hypothetical protein